MGIRMDQYVGHCSAAEAFLEENEVQPKICLYCKQPLPYMHISKWAHFPGCSMKSIHFGNVS